jgi:hypothetical protein
MPEDDDTDVPLGSWRRLYAAVLVNLVVLILLSAVFSKWSY